MSSNTGYQYVRILKQVYADDKTDTGLHMPNIQQISPQAIVPTSSTITFNYYNNVAPTEGMDGDIWYNYPADILYKRISGIWTTLNDRVFNDAYIAPVYDVTSCPL